MVQVTVKSIDAMKELLTSMSGGGAVTFNVNDKVAAELFKVAVEKRLLEKVSFCNEGNKKENKKDEGVKKYMKGLTPQIKRIFEENPTEEITQKDIRNKISMDVDCQKVAQCLGYLVKSGYLAVDKTGEINKYKKA